MSKCWTSIPVSPFLLSGSGAAVYTSLPMYYVLIYDVQILVLLSPHSCVEKSIRLLMSPKVPLLLLPIIKAYPIILHTGLKLRVMIKLMRVMESIINQRIH